MLSHKGSDAPATGHRNMDLLDTADELEMSMGSSYITYLFCILVYKQVSVKEKSYDEPLALNVNITY